MNDHIPVEKVASIVATMGRLGFTVSVPPSDGAGLDVLTFRAPPGSRLMLGAVIADTVPELMPGILSGPPETSRRDDGGPGVTVRFPGYIIMR